MTRFGPPSSTPIDDFLAGAGSSSEGERWEAIGAGLGLAGTLLAVGVVILLAVVHRGRRSEVQALLALAMAGGAAMLVGGAIEVAGTAQVLDVGWIDALTDGSASSAMLRLLGGLLVLLGLGDETAPVPGDAIDAAIVAASTDPEAASRTDIAGEAGAASETVADDRADDLADDRADGSGTRRWVVGASSAFGVVGLVLGVLSFAFDGHTVSEGPRVLHAAVNLVHVVAGGIWFGGVVGLAVLVFVRRRQAESVGELLGAFSRVATAALAAVFLAGVGLTTMVLDDPGQLTGTEWGRRLLVKVVAVGVAALLGAYHHLVVVPRVGDASTDRIARRTITVEAVVLTVAVVMSALVARASIT